MKTTCGYPISMWQRLDKTKPNGKAIILQNVPDRHVPARLILRDCGQCTGCRLRRRMDLSLRLEHEAYFYDDVWFITLTYDDENLPDHGSLRADDMPLFIRKLRDMHRKKQITIRYFGVGEYGGTMGRPHYHMIVFGLPIDDAEHYYSRPDTRFHSPEFINLMGGGRLPEFKYYKSATLERAWNNKGLVQCTSVSAATMDYVSKFHIEKVSGELAKHAYEVIDHETGELITIEQEKARMSRNPGIGHKWIETFWRDVYPKGYITRKGTKIAPPKYYDRWLEKHHPQLYAEVKTEREKAIDIELYLDAKRKAIDTNRKAQMDCPIHLKT